MLAVGIRPEDAEDCAAIFEVHRLAFGTVAEAKLVDSLRDSGDSKISLVAEADNEVIAHLLFSELAAPMRALALAPVAVLPSRQRQGVGSKLIRAGLRAAKQDGWEAVFVLGEPEYYERFGFNVHAAKGFTCAYAGDYFMALFLGGATPTHGTIIYPRPFAALG